VADKTLADVLTKETLDGVAFSESYDCGRGYRERDREKALKKPDGVVSARVHGSLRAVG
jgi:hypothetical protein